MSTPSTDAVTTSCEAALHACKSCENHDGPKRSDYSDHLFPNLEEYLSIPNSSPSSKGRQGALGGQCVESRVDRLQCSNVPAERVEAYEEPQKVKEEAGSCDRFRPGRKRRPIPRVQRYFVLNHIRRRRLQRTSFVRTCIPSMGKNPELQKFRVEPMRIKAPWACVGSFC